MAAWKIVRASNPTWQPLRKLIKSKILVKGNLIKSHILVKGFGFIYLYIYIYIYI